MNNFYYRSNGFGPSLEAYKHNSTDSSVCYILEVQKYVGGGFIHIGYMNAKFNYVEEACSYYNTYNPNMKHIDTNKTILYSDIHDNTHLRYIVRQYNNELLTLDPFDTNDIPTVKTISNKCKMISYPTLFPRSIYIALQDNTFSI